MDEFIAAFRAFMAAEHKRAGDDFWAHAAMWNVTGYAQGFVAGYTRQPERNAELISACYAVRSEEVCPFCERVHSKEYFKDKQKGQ